MAKESRFSIAKSMYFTIGNVWRWKSKSADQFFKTIIHSFFFEQLYGKFQCNYFKKMSEWIYLKLSTIVGLIVRQMQKPATQPRGSN